MKSAFTLLLCFLLAGLCAAAGPDRNSGTIRIPGLSGAIRPGMKVSEAEDVLTEAGQVLEEQLRNGMTYVVSYKLQSPLVMEFIDNGLIRVQFDYVAPGSDFAKWFSSAVAALPDSVTRHSGRVLPVTEDYWSTPGSLWGRVMDPAWSKEQLFVVFEGSRCELPGGMVVCRDSADVSPGDTTIHGPAYEVPPQPKPDHCPQPEFPDLAKRNGIQGKVMVRAYVDEKGVVRKWLFSKIDPVGWGFARAVENVITDWRFSPALKDGKPIGVWVAVPFNFHFRHH